MAIHARETGIEIETGARGLTPAHLQDYLEISRRLSARLLRFVVDAGNYEPSLDKISGVIHDALPALNEASITLGIENHDRFPCAALRRLVEDIGSERVGICLDTANSLGAGEGIGEVLAQLAPVCVNLHIKDFAIARLPHLMGFTVTGRVLGEGMLPLNQVLETIASCGRCETAIVETWPPPESEMSATLAKEKDWAERSVQVLRAALGQIGGKSSK
ncbi:MAG: TIM barrel protein [Verrucomicrobiota bacterium]